MSSPARAPQRLGNYRLLRPLARGGMGEIYLARQEGPRGFARTVAVKTILPELSQDPSFQEMFLNEARLAGLLTHPNVVQLIELGEADGVFFIAMEYVPGRSLRQTLDVLATRGERFPVGLAVWITGQVLRGLHFAHRLCDERGRPLGLIHRDLTPSNVLLGLNGAVKVADFGIAKASALSVKTASGLVRGSLPYLSPEQVRGEATGPGTDIYMTAATLYETLAGARPFVAEAEYATFEMILKRPPRPPRELRPELSEALEELLLKGLAKKAQDRFASAEQMALALEGYLLESGERVDTWQAERFLSGLFSGLSEPAESDVAEPATELAAGPATSPDRPPADAGSGVAVLTQLVPGSGARAARAAGRGWLWPGIALAATLAALASGYWLVRAPPSRQAPAAQLDPVPAPAAPPPPAAVSAAAPPTSSPPAPPSPVVEAPPPVRTAEPPKAAAAPRPSGRGSVHFLVNPWAEVYWRGKRVGVTPLAPIPVPAGKQVFRLRNPKLDKERTVEVSVRPGEQRVVKVDLLAPLTAGKLQLFVDLNADGNFLDAGELSPVWAGRTCAYENATGQPIPRASRSRTC